MHCDNRIFDINGKGSEALAKAIDLAYLQSGSAVAYGFHHSVEFGLILDWGGGGNQFPAPLSAVAVVPVVEAYLQSDEAGRVELKSWDMDSGHDGSSSVGWRVAVGEWGHVKSCRSAICAIRRVYLWHGK